MNEALTSVVRTSTIGEIADALLAAATPGASNWFSVRGEPLSVVVKTTHASLTPHEQGVVRQAVAQAIASWTLPTGGFAALAELADCAINIRAHSSLPHFLRIARVYRCAEREGEESDAVSAVFSAIAGLGPNVEVTAYLADIMLSASTNPGYAGQLLVGLCRGAPRAFPRWLSAFRGHQVLIADIDYFVIRRLAKDTVRELGLSMLASRVHVLDAAATHVLGQLLAALHPEPYYVDMLDKKEDVIVRSTVTKQEQILSFTPAQLDVLLPLIYTVSKRDISERVPELAPFMSVFQ